MVDNSGNAPTIDNVETVRPDKNLGYAGGANVGLRRWLDAGGEFCVVASHDLHVEPSTLADLVACAEANPQVGVLGPAVNDIRPHGAVDEVTDVAWLSGSCLLLRRSCVTAAGLFDERFGSYVEDVDLCWRAKAEGWRVAVAPGTVVHGNGSSSSQWVHMMFVNTFYLQAKHHGPLGLAKTAAAVPLNVMREARQRRWDRVRARFTSLPAGMAKGASALRLSHVPACYRG